MSIVNICEAGRPSDLLAQFLHHRKPPPESQLLEQLKYFLHTARLLDLNWTTNDCPQHVINSRLGTLYRNRVVGRIGHFEAVECFAGTRKKDETKRSG